jgi:hypothetical protein
MDPFRAASSISALCVTGAKLMVAFYEYIDEVRDVPRSVEQLTGELSALNSALQQFKLRVAVHQERRTTFSSQWADDSTKMLDRCSETLEQIGVMMVKAKVESKSTSKGQVIRCMKWVWHKQEVNLLRESLKVYEVTILLMLQAMSG